MNEELNNNIVVEAVTEDVNQKTDEAIHRAEEMKTKRLSQIDTRIEDIDDKLKDLTEELSKGMDWCNVFVYKNEIFWVAAYSFLVRRTSIVISTNQHQP